MKNKLLPILLGTFFIIVFLVNFFVRDPEAYPMIRLIPFVLSISLGIISTLYAASVYGFGSLHGRALLVLTLGMSFILGGDLIYSFILVTQEVIPSPSIADISYILGYVFFVIGFMMEMKIYKVDMSKFSFYSRLFGGLIILVIAIAILYLQIYLQYNPTVSLLTNFARVAFGICDLLLLIIIAPMLRMSLSFHEGKFFQPWFAVVLAIVSSLIGDLVYAISFEKYINIEWPFTMINIFWVEAYLLVTFAFIRIGNLIREAQNVFQKKS